MPRWARSLSAVALGLAAIAAGGERAQAAAPWSEPQSIGGELGRIVFASDGQGMLVGLAQNLPASPRRGRVLVATLNGGTPAPPRVSTTSLDLSTVRVYERDGVVAAGFLRPGVSPHVALARGRIGRPLGRPQSLRGRSRASQLLDLAVNPAGDAVAAVRWCQTTGCGRQTLALFRRRAGARLSRPLRIARGRRLGAGVALNARGDVAILWDRFSARGRRDVFGQIVTASGKLWPARRLGAAPAAPRYHIAMTNDRRVVAAWVAQEINECFAHVGEIAVAQAGKGGHFGRAQRLTTLAVTGCGRSRAIRRCNSPERPTVAC